MIKDLQLCGLGNGLVDLLYSVEEGVVEGIGLKKGEMRLVESDKQKEVVAKFANHKHSRCSGGSAANSVIAFSQLGGKAAYKTVLGNDELGAFYASEFENMGIILKAEHIEEDPTGTCFVFITPDSERTMHTSLGATGHFSSKHIHEDLIARSEWLYTEGYKFTHPLSTEALFLAVEYAKKHNTKVALTFSDVFVIDLFKDNLQKVVRNCDLIFCNENEAMAYTGASNVEDAFEELKKEVPNLVVTLGAKGSKVFWEGKYYEIPSYPASPIDTTGAGDMFAGCFMYGIITLKDPVQAGHLASLAAAKIVSQIGARYSGELKDLFNDLMKELK